MSEPTGEAPQSDTPQEAGSTATPQEAGSTVTASQGSGIPVNVAGALCYLLGPITGILFFIIDRPRPFVRFHAVQAIGVTIAWIVLVIALMLVNTVLGFIPILGWIAGILLSLGMTVAGFGIWLFLMYKAYNGQTWELPGLGPHVRRIAAETGEAA